MGHILDTGIRKPPLWLGKLFISVFIILLVYYAGMVFAGNEESATETTLGTAPEIQKPAPPASKENLKNNPTYKLPKPAPRARWSEDWSTLGNAAPFTNTEPTIAKRLWLTLKHIPLNNSKESYLSLGGEARLAWELYKDKDMGISDIGRQDALQLRLAAHADWHINRKWRIFGELGYGAVDDREGGEKAADETNPDIWQLFVNYRWAVQDSERLVLRAGRQIIEVANLFINAGEGNNVRQVYDGFRFGWIQDSFIPLDVFAAEYVDFSDGSFDMSGTGEYFWGFRTGFRLPAPELNLHLFYSGWDLKGRQFEQGGAGRYDELRHTILFWLDRPLTINKQWGLDYYLAYQFGEYNDRPGGSNISAFAAFGEMKYAFSTTPVTPLTGLKTSYFSGDKDPSDNQLNTFYNPVFATPYFGYARDIQPFNLIFIQPYIGYSFGDEALVTFGHGLHWRANTNDAFYGAPNGITARATTSDSSWLGQQTQLSLRYWPLPNLLISSYIANFFAGDVIKDAGGTDRFYFHIGFHYLL
jgi:hypothetical protein